MCVCVVCILGAPKTPRFALLKKKKKTATKNDSEICISIYVASVSLPLLCAASEPKRVNVGSLWIK